MRGTIPTIFLTPVVLSALLMSCGQPVKTPTQPADARVFGIRQGQALTSLKEAHRIPLSVWGNDALVDYVFVPPEPDPAFTQYAAFVTAKHGVCQIKAQTPGLKVGVPAPIQRNRFDLVKKGLEAKYGPPSTSLARSFMWEKGPNSPSKLPKEIIFVSLDYYAADGGMGLTYNFSNFKDCTKDIHLKWTF